MERSWIRRQRAGSQRCGGENSGKGSVEDFSFLLREETKERDDEGKGSSEDVFFGMKPMMKRMSSSKQKILDATSSKDANNFEAAAPRRRATQGIPSPTSDVVRRAWTTRRKSRRRTVESSIDAKQKRAAGLRKLIAKKRNIADKDGMRRESDDVPHSPDIPPPEPPAPPPVAVKTPDSTHGAFAAEERANRSSSSDVLVAAAASAARRLSTGSGSPKDDRQHRRVSRALGDNGSTENRRASLRDLADLLDVAGARENRSDSNDLAIVTSTTRKKQRSWTMTRSFSSPMKPLGVGATSSFGASQSSRNLGIASKTSIVSSHFSSSASSLVFALLLKQKRSGWHMRSSATWVPRRFEIEKGMLKVFEHGADHQSATMHLSHSTIAPIDAVDTKKSKTDGSGGSKYSSKKKSRVKLLFFVVTSTIGEHEVIEIGSDNHELLKQCYRAVKLAAVSPTFIQRRHLRYEERDVLGKGASGVVYKAQYFGTNVALKRLFAPTTSPQMGRLQRPEKKKGGAEETDEAMEDLIKELRLLSRFRHPNIISFLGISFDPFARASSSSKQGLSAISMVMEYCPYDLDTLLHDRKYRHHWSRRQFVSIVSEITCGMSFLHSHGVIHRDLKPQNLMLTDSLSVRIVDFGVSRLYADRRKTMTGYVGTPAYMSPEVIEGKSYDGCADVFSFAIILHEMWSGRRPYHDIKQQFTMMRKVCKGYRMPMPTTRRKRDGGDNTRATPSRPGFGGLLESSVRGISPSPARTSSSSSTTTTVWPKALAEFIGRCWHHDPQLRPSFAKLDTIWRGDVMQKQIQEVKTTCWFSKTSDKAHKLLGLAPHASPDRVSDASRKRPLTSPRPVKPPPTTRQLQLKRDVEGRVGITFDDSLTILTASEWARRYGVRAGQRIVGCEARPVRTKTELMRYLPKDPARTIRMEIVMPGRTSASSSSHASVDRNEEESVDRNKKTSDNVVQCLDGPLQLNAVQKTWFDKCMKPEGVKRTATKSLLMAMLIQLQA